MENTKSNGGIENNSPDSPIPDYAAMGRENAQEEYRSVIKTKQKESIKNEHSDDAFELLQQAIKEMEDRAVKYDNLEGERSMASAIGMFNILTDSHITERQGWILMTILKMVRAEYNGYRKDDYVDGAAYFALCGESAAKE